MYGNYKSVKRAPSILSEAGANSGLLWLTYYIPKGTAPERPSDGIDRNYLWIAVAGVLSLVFIFVLERRITLHRWRIFRKYRYAVNRVMGEPSARVYSKLNESNKTFHEPSTFFHTVR
jgi:hypothetical protein